MKRQIINIDEEKCTGCGLCIPGCPEGAIQLIDGKARLVSDLFCDGLGACLGHCPEGAIKIEEREAEPYDERKVMENIIKQGPNTIKAHIEHLREHNETEFLQQAITILQENSLPVPVEKMVTHAHHAGCPGSRAIEFNTPAAVEESSDDLEGRRPSQLRHWPVQMHLISPNAPQFRDADVLLAADCVAFSVGDFHKNYLKGKALAIACPKLDSGTEIYLEKLIAMIDHAQINTLTVIIMQVPCCRGLVMLAQQAVEKAQRKVPIKGIVISIEGEVLREEWLSN